MDKPEFILAAINDTQSTIRATDAKVVAFLAGVFLPFSKVDRVWAHLNYLHISYHDYISYILGGAFLFFWLLSIICLVRSISAIDNPGKHISDHMLKKGSFYAGGLYKFSLIDLVWNRSSIKTESTVSSFETHYPEDIKRDGQGASIPVIVEELAFEHMKLAYIRDIKLHRLHYAFISMHIWFVLGLVIYLLSKFT